MKLSDDRKKLLQVTNEDVQNGQFIIPETVTSIDASAFHDCTRLTQVTIPSSVESIGDEAFHGCTRLTQVTIPASVESIGVEAFRCCTRLTQVTISNSVKVINNGAFFGCTGLTQVTIPDSVTSIGVGSFKGCTGLTQITIPNSVTSIDKSAFYKCTNLTHITIPDSVKSIVFGAFAGCTNLTQVTIPGSVKSISPFAFANCSSLQVIAIEDEDDKEYHRLVNLLPPAQQHLARPWSELKAAETIKQQALMPMAALSMRGLTAHLILKLPIKPSENFLSVWTQLPRYLNMFENSHAWPCRKSLFSHNCTPIPAPGFATMFHQINKKMAFHLNPAVAQIPLPISQEQFVTLFTRVTETAIPYSRRVLLKPVQSGRAPENCSDEDIQVASPGLGGS